MESFDSRALQLAFDLTTKNTYDGKVGQGYNEARAEDIRRVYNVLCGREANDNGNAPAPKAAAAPRKRKTDTE